METNKFWRAVGLATFVSGALDAIAAITVYGIFYHFNPIQIYQFVASGMLGPSAYTGGVSTAILGLFIHFLIASVASLAFVWAYTHVNIFRGGAVMVGLVYGLVIWLVMNLIVVPLSQIPPSHFDKISVIAILWHMFLVGLPIALITKACHTPYQGA